jgi:hypothetical protein
LIDNVKKISNLYDSYLLEANYKGFFGEKRNGSEKTLGCDIKCMQGGKHDKRIFTFASSCIFVIIKRQIAERMVG